MDLGDRFSTFKIRLKRFHFDKVYSLGWIWWPWTIPQLCCYRLRPLWDFMWYAVMHWAHHLHFPLFIPQVFIYPCSISLSFWFLYLSVFVLSSLPMRFLPFLSLPSNPSWQVASWALFSQVFLLVKREFFKVLAHRGLFKCQRFHQNTIGALPYSIKHFFFKHTNFRMKQVTFLGVLFYSWQSNSSTLMYCVYSSLLHGIWHFTMHYLWPFLWLFEESKKITFQPNLSMN